MDAQQLETTLLKLSHDAPITEIEGGFKGHLILSANGTNVYASPKTILRTVRHTGKPAPHSGLAYIVTDGENRPLTDYKGVGDMSATPKAIGVREATYGEFIEKYGSLFAYNEVDFEQVINDPFASLLARL